MKVATESHGQVPRLAQGRLVDQARWRGRRILFINGRDWRCTALWFGKRMGSKWSIDPGLLSLPIKRKLQPR